ncbi:MAG: NAD(P)-dependent oxidoreductase [Candidatus Pelagadaptatus aseana]|uniref:NAD(P)-dependent oxidoreductase n=1 Tax=Candidatus Pelagadaptatus aseana TaxID=3120508 RepID=UPI0039B29AA9
MPTTSRIGFIGMGLMGAPMSLRLLKAGFQVSVWNRNPDKTQPLTHAGAIACNSLQQLAESSDIIMMCVSDTQAVEDVIFGDHGLCHNLKPGQIIVDFSSIAPDATQKFAYRIQQHHRCHWLDCPVSGGVAGAENGTLVIMAGGDDQSLKLVTPALNAVSQRITHMGPSGSGQATKVCNQMLVSCNVMVMAEVLALAEKSGVDASKIPAALKGGFADTIPLQLTGSRMVNNDFDEVKWHIKTLLKDLTLAEELASQAQGATPMAAMAKQLMQQQAEAGLADQDPANLIKHYRK